MTTWQKALWEATKDAIRTVWFAVAPIVIAGIDTKTGAISIDWRVVFAVASVTLIIFIDSSIHHMGKLTDNDMLKKGLSFGV